MRVIFIATSLLTAGLACLAGQALAAPQDGQALQRMCQGADKVKALSVMCHSYLNGYLDAAAVLDKSAPVYCISEGDKARMPAEVVGWLNAHPEAIKEPAPILLKKALAEHFPCKRGK
jgi:hypothetical protein